GAALLRAAVGDGRAGLLRFLRAGAWVRGAAGIADDRTRVPTDDRTVASTDDRAIVAAEAGSLGGNLGVVAGRRRGADQVDGGTGQGDAGLAAGDGRGRVARADRAAAATAAAAGDEGRAGHRQERQREGPFEPLFGASGCVCEGCVRNALSYCFSRQFGLQ